MNTHQNRLNSNQVVADRRTITQWISDACRSPSIRGYLYLIAAFVILIWPISTPVVFIALLPALFSTRIPDVPLRLPMEANIPDRSDPKPGGEGFHRARGAVYLGNERGSNKEAWTSWNDQRLHDYVMGATGSGKTETILAINANYVLSGSGFIIGDGKGTMLFPKQTTTLARIAGADDDSFVISFLSGYQDQYGRTPLKRSNLINPFGEGNASTVKELLTSLMSQGGGENAIFADGAASLADSLAPAWVEGRDRGFFDFNITYIAQSLALAKVFELSNHPKLSELSKQHITNYLANLGYNFEKSPNEQPENCTRMHGYYVNYFMRVVTSFAISYRHIYLCKQGEVNMRDTVKSRRCLTFTLPPLEKSPDEVQNLGKTLLVSARSASSYGLGTTMEGSRETSVDKLPSNHPVPYKFNFDEFSFYVLEGFSLLPAQLRGINISCLVGAQDYIGTTRAGDIDAESIFANARTKLFGALEDQKTWEKVREIVGEVDMAVYDRLMNLGTVGGRYVPDLDLRLTRRCPLEIQELQEQVEGQFHVMQRGKVRKIKTYYPEINEDTVLDDFYLIRLVPTFKPNEDSMNRLQMMQNFLDMLSQQERLFQSPGILKNAGTRTKSESADEDAINSLLAFHSKARFSIDLHQQTQTTADTSTNSNSQEHTQSVNTSTVPAYQTNSEAEEIDIPSYQDDAQTRLNEHESSIEEWGASLTEQENSVIETDPSYDSEDDLLAQTQQYAIEYYQNQNTEIESNGVFGISDLECNAIQKRYELLGMLLGESEDEAKSDAIDIVKEMRRSVFYLIPPKPNAATDIKEKVATLFEQVDLFSKEVDA